jgi:hypothetical protein
MLRVIGDMLRHYTFFVPVHAIKRRTNEAVGWDTNEAPLFGRGRR